MTRSGAGRHHIERHSIVGRDEVSIEPTPGGGVTMLAVARSPREGGRQMRSERGEIVMNALRALALVCMGCWVGILAFFSFAAAPRLFRTLERRDAGELVAALLPSYYQWGIALSGLAVGALVVLAARAGAGRRRHLAGAALGALMVGCLVWGLGVGLPEANRARSAGDDTAFAVAHRRAVQVHGLVSRCGLVVIALEAFTPAARLATPVRRNPR